MTESHRERDSEQRSGLHGTDNRRPETPGWAGGRAGGEAGQGREEGGGAAGRAGAGNQRAADKEQRAAAPGAHPEPSPPPTG